MNRRQTEAFLVDIVQAYLEDVQAGPGFDDDYDEQQTLSDFALYIGHLHSSASLRDACNAERAAVLKRGGLA